MQQKNATKIYFSRIWDPSGPTVPASIEPPRGASSPDADRNPEPENPDPDVKGHGHNLGIRSLTE